MKKQLYTLLSLIILVACNIPLVAEDAMTGTTPAAPAKAPAHLIYLTGQESAWKNFPPAPTPGSVVDNSDLAITLAAQASRTEEQKTEADHDKTYGITLVTEAIDPAFQTKYPNIFEMLQRADNDEHFINGMMKKTNSRPRPYVEHPLLVTALFPVSGFSYPSGHSSGTEVQARILAVLFPAQADAVLKRARMVADSRVVAGVHYASDIAAGRTLGDLIFNELEANAQFKKDLAAAAAKDQIPLK